MQIRPLLLLAVTWFVSSGAAARVRMTPVKQFYKLFYHQLMGTGY